MSRPFFSVVIPTKNRSFLVKSGIWSVLKQSFDDFEIVILDNDDTEETRKVVERISDPRLSYFRTGGLSMPDNWDLGSRSAKGEYIMFLEDRQLLKIRALEKICAAIKGNNNPLVVSWCCDSVYDHQVPVKVSRVDGTGRHFFVSSDEVIRNFLSYGRRGGMKNILPRGLNSCIHYSLAEQIRRKTGGRLCLPVAPDYTMTFLQLAFAENLLHIDEAMVITRGFKYSNGMNFMFKKDTSLRYMGDIGGVSAYYELVPIKSPIIANCLFNDYEKIRRLVGEKLSKYPINIYNYFLQCYQDIEELRNLGVDMQEEETELRRALSEQDKAIQESLLVVMDLLEQKNSRLIFQTERAEKFKSEIKAHGIETKRRELKRLEKEIKKLREDIGRKEEYAREQFKRAEMFKAKIKDRDERLKKLEMSAKEEKARAEKFKAKLKEKGQDQ